MPAPTIKAVISPDRRRPFHWYRQGPTVRGRMIEGLNQVDHAGRSCAGRGRFVRAHAGGRVVGGRAALDRTGIPDHRQRHPPLGALQVPTMTNAGNTAPSYPQSLGNVDLPFGAMLMLRVEPPDGDPLNGQVVAVDQLPAKSDIWRNRVVDYALDLLRDADGVEGRLGCGDCTTDASKTRRTLVDPRGLPRGLGERPRTSSDDGPPCCLCKS